MGIIFTAAGYIDGGKIADIEIEQKPRTSGLSLARFPLLSDVPRGIIASDRGRHRCGITGGQCRPICVSFDPLKRSWEGISCSLDIEFRDTSSICGCIEMEISYFSIIIIVRVYSSARYHFCLTIFKRAVSKVTLILILSYSLIYFVSKFHNRWSIKLINYTIIHRAPVV